MMVFCDTRFHSWCLETLLDITQSKSLLKVCNFFFFLSQINDWFPEQFQDIALFESCQHVNQGMSFGRDQEDYYKKNYSSIKD